MIHYSEGELNTIYQDEKFISEYNDYSKDNNDLIQSCRYCPYSFSYSDYIDHKLSSNLDGEVYKISTLLIE